MVKICKWKTNDKYLFLIHIREYKQGYYGMFMATEKGIALTYEVWQNFIANIEHIKEDVEEFWN